MTAGGWRTLAGLVLGLTACTSNYVIYPDGRDDVCEELDGDGEQGECNQHDDTEADCDAECEQCEDEQASCLAAAQDPDDEVACDHGFRQCSGQDVNCYDAYDTCVLDEQSGDEQEICSCIYFLCTGEVTATDHDDPGCGEAYQACLDEQEPEAECECEYQACIAG